MRVRNTIVLAAATAVLAAFPAHAATPSFPGRPFKAATPVAPDTLGGVFPFACGIPS